MGPWYKLDENHNPVPCDSAEAEALLCNEEGRRVREHYLCGDKIHVSTVFLVLDHGRARGGQRLFFETMIFGGDHDGYQMRCTTWDEAIEMHTKALDLVWATEVSKGHVN